MSTEFKYTREWTDAEAFPLLSFTKNWENPSDYPTYEPDEMQVRKDMQSLHDEVKNYLNDVLIPAVIAEDATVDAWTQAETERVQAETQRLESETARYTAEQNRETAETQRENAETARIDEERRRDAAEQERILAEQVRVYQEQLREEAEGGRREAEDARCVWEEYDSTKRYVPGNKVSYGGSSYVNVFPCTGEYPDRSDVWQLIAERGVDGVDGRDGVNGRDGYTPLRGIDYWTHADQEYIVEQVLAAETIQKLEADVDNLSNLINPFKVTSFTCTPSTAENGAEVTVVLSWELSKTPTVVTLDGRAMPAAQSGGTTQAYVSDTTKWTLKAKDERGTNVSSEAAKITFLNRVYYGAAAEPASFTDIDVVSKFISSLVYTPPTNTNKRTFEVDGGGNYIWYCCPVSLGKCAFKSNGFPAGIELVATVRFRNALGYETNYYVYRSNQRITDVVTVEVS